MFYKKNQYIENNFMKTTKSIFFKVKSNLLAPVVGGCWGLGAFGGTTDPG